MATPIQTAAALGGGRSAATLERWRPLATPTIALELPDALIRRAGWAPRAVHQPVEDVIAAILDGVLPALDDVPADMQAELVEMTWLDDVALLAIAGALLSEADRRRLVELSGRDSLSDAERKELDGLRERYGKVTLRKARALALLSVRSGKGSLAQAA